MAASYQGLPIGVGHIDVSILTGVQQTLALVFMVAVRLAAPIVVTLLIVELAIGLISPCAAQQVPTEPTSTHIFPAGGRRGTVVPVRALLGSYSVPAGAVGWAGCCGAV